MDANTLMPFFFFFFFEGGVGVGVWGCGLCCARDQLKQQVIEVQRFQRQMLFTIMYKQNNHSWQEVMNHKVDFSVHTQEASINMSNCNHMVHSYGIAIFREPS